MFNLTIQEALDPNRRSTVEWMQEAVDTAWAEAKRQGGSMVPLNTLGAVPAFAMYINTVKTGALSNAQFAAQYAPMLQEAEVIRQQYERINAVPEIGKRVSSLEESLGTVEKGITAILSKLGISLTEEETPSEPAADNPGAPDPAAGHVPTPSPAPVPPPPADPAPAKPKGKKPAAPPPAPVTPPAPAPAPTGDEQPDDGGDEE